MNKRKTVFRPAPFLRPPLLLAVAALVSAMVFTAEITGLEAVIFPEIAALAFGAWGTRARPWMATNFDLFLSPTLAAFTGWFVINYIPGPLTLRAGCAFVLVLLELRITASAVLPSISAAILPLVAGEASLYYPVAVAAFTAAIALVCYILDWTGHGNYTKVRLKYHFLPQRRQLPALLFRWGRVLAITLACAWLSEYTPICWPRPSSSPVLNSSTRAALSAKDPSASISWSFWAARREPERRGSPPRAGFPPLWRQV